MTALNIIQIILAILLTVAVLMQSQGSGLGSAWGGTSESYHTRRGMEKVVFYSTIVFAALFTVVSIIVLI